MILLISDTPVAGTVERLTEWIETISGIKTIPLIKRNYAHHAFSLSRGTFGGLPNWKLFLSNYVKEANLIILHNSVDEGLINTIFRQKNNSTSIIYQLHSPPFEGPQYTYDILEKYRFDAVLSVNQGHGRFFRNSIPVPNIIASLPEDVNVEKEKSIFIPHIRTTSFKWSNKFSKNDLESIKRSSYLFENLSLKSIKDLYNRDIVSHTEILLALASSTFVIDDINTGLIHQTAFEGIKSGCAVFSAADAFTIEEYSNSISAPPPPLIHISNIDDIIKQLINGEALDFYNEKSKLIIEYSKSYLSEERIAGIYFNSIQKYLN